MPFNKHLNYVGKHSFLSPSQFHWIRYDEEKLDAKYLRAMASAKGTRLHELAASCIREGIKLQGRSTMAQYVNDAIGFRMESEVVLFYSNNCFGTADTIGFRKERGSRNFKLRIHDLKTGETPASMDQLMVYTSIFCHEYGFKPSEIDIELRIYQNDEIHVYEPELDEIVHIMDKIVTFDQRIERLKEQLED